MTVKLVRLKSGEDVITDVSEMYTDKSKDPEVSSTTKSLSPNPKPQLVGYLFKRPCVAYMDVIVDAEGKKGHKVELISWMPLTKDDQIPVPLDWVVTMTTPVDKLMEMYQKDVVNFENDD